MEKKSYITPGNLLNQEFFSGIPSSEIKPFGRLLYFINENHPFFIVF